MHCQQTVSFCQGSWGRNTVIRGQALCLRLLLLCEVLLKIHKPLWTLKQSASRSGSWLSSFQHCSHQLLYFALSSFALSTSLVLRPHPSFWCLRNFSWSWCRLRLPLCQTCSFLFFGELILSDWLAFVLSILQGLPSCIWVFSSLLLLDDIWGQAEWFL